MRITILFNSIKNGSTRLGGGLSRLQPKGPHDFMIFMFTNI
jgi:hypothetical protein